MCYYTSEMACPYFDPAQRIVYSHDSRLSMLPLGDSWAGVCRALPAEPVQPDDATLYPLCNLGYARGACKRFPAGDGPDAVRFTISRDDGASVGVYYVVERDHHPYAHGALEFSMARDGFVAPPAGETLCRQARAYVESYLYRKSEAIVR